MATGLDDCVMAADIVQLPAVGWREWLALPSLGISRIKAKVDTGARTSAIHAFDLELYETEAEEKRVRFKVHPIQGDLETMIECDEIVSEHRSVRDSGGHEEIRPFITIPVTLGPHTWEIEASLTNRDNMKFRMLLGRAAIKNRFVVDSSSSYRMRTDRIE